MLFIALGLIALLYSGFVTLSIVMQFIYKLTKGSAVSFNLTKCMFVAMIGTALICYGVTVL